jgi:hypothetical protein
MAVTAREAVAAGMEYDQRKDAEAVASRPAAAPASPRAAQLSAFAEQGVVAVAPAAAPRVRGVNSRPLTIEEYAAKQAAREARAKELSGRSKEEVEQKFRQLNRVAGPASKSEMVSSILDNEGLGSHFRHANSDAMEEQHKKMKPAERAAAAAAHRDQPQQFGAAAAPSVLPKPVSNPEEVAADKSQKAGDLSVKAKASGSAEDHKAAAVAHAVASGAHSLTGTGAAAAAYHQKLAGQHAEESARVAVPAAAAVEPEGRKAKKLKAFAAETQKKEEKAAAPMGGLLVTKHGTPYRIGPSGRRIYVKKG